MRSTAIPVRADCVIPTRSFETTTKLQMDSEEKILAFENEQNGSGEAQRNRTLISDSKFHGALRECRFILRVISQIKSHLFDRTNRGNPRTDLVGHL